MTIKEQLRSDLTGAMKARQASDVATLRMVLSAITNAEVAGSEAVELSDEQVIGVLRKEAKKRTESAELFEQAGRADRAEAERAEAAIIERYLPAAMTDDALAAIVAEAIAQTGASSPKDMGLVVKAVRTRVEGQADGSRIAEAVKAALR